MAHAVAMVNVFRRLLGSKRDGGESLSSSGIVLITARSAPKLGRIRSGRFELSLDGEITRETWLAVPSAFPSLILDVFAVLPGEFRAIVRNASGADPDTIAEQAVAWFMEKSREHLRILRGPSITKLWKDCSVRPIRSDDDLQLERMRILMRARV